ncbi:MAG: hypothetical protein GWP14_01240 [Actinobacteria bacterium]|nr:hypothetical protein [Actinomycetota bacterium]
MTSYTGLALVLAKVNFSPFEFGMFTCFGVCWLASIYKSLKSKRTEGKSLLFLCIVWVGYIFGVIHKIFYNPDFVLALYICNVILVFIDIMLYLRYSRHSMATLKVPFTLR